MVWRLLGYWYENPPVHELMRWSTGYKVPTSKPKISKPTELSEEEFKTLTTNIGLPQQMPEYMRNLIEMAEADRKKMFKNG